MYIKYSFLNGFTGFLKLVYNFMNKSRNTKREFKLEKVKNINIVTQNHKIDVILKNKKKAQFLFSYSVLQIHLGSLQLISSVHKDVVCRDASTSTLSD